MGGLHGICRIHMDHAAFSAASAAASSSCNLINDGGGLTTMLLFHCRSNFLDNLLPIPSSISLSRLTVSKRAIYKSKPTSHKYNPKLIRNINKGSLPNNLKNSTFAQRDSKQITEL